MIQVDRLDPARLDGARRIVKELGSVLVAFSGGVDSTLLLRLCMDELGAGAVAALAASPAFSAAELDDARSLAQAMGARLVEVETGEMALEPYLANGPDRCFHCRDELFGVLEPVRARLGLGYLAYGATADDLQDHRPGHGSALRRGVRFPLLEAGLGKPQIRAAARGLGLPNWDRPSLACLSSRIPHGTRITEPALRQIERAEAAVRGLGFRQVRVRHHGDVARLEVEEGEIARALELREELGARLRGCGYRFAALDLEGYRTGKLSRPARGRP
ncbi:MAG: ATP-dependent sacrificial sulfur transferase LarE [Candidatus Dormibacterales bacterium]